MPDTEKKPPAPTIGMAGEFRHTEDFVSRYANNLQIESNVFDLKLVFGLLDQRASMANPSANASVEQHTAVNLSWPQVKLLIFYMRLNLAVHEHMHGEVKVPDSVFPPEVPLNPPPPFDDAKGHATFDLMRTLRAEFIASLKR